MANLVAGDMTPNQTNLPAGLISPSMKLFSDEDLISLHKGRSARNIGMSRAGAMLAQRSRMTSATGSSLPQLTNLGEHLIGGANKDF